MKRLLGSIAVTTVLAMAACSDGSAYVLMEKRELARGVRYDSLLFDVYFGMERQEFFDHCRNMNREGIVKEGPGGNTVEYKLDNLPYPAKVNFYPDFDDDNRIYKMRLYFHYDAWAPWNKPQWSDSLMPEVVTLLQGWYEGVDFIKIEPEDVENKSPLYAKVDGNRRIVVFKDGDMKVRAIITDLTSAMVRNKKRKDMKG
ncbi:MAG: hypothetical protein KF852_04025 [Saprospiraceae bacterium]|nr:hypothetical protein [Saprospiraceae bacterium]